MQRVLAGSCLALALLVPACSRPDRQAAQTVGATPAAVAASATTAAPLAAAPAAAEWCHVVPLERSFCRALVVDAPKRALRLALAQTDAQREHGLMGVAAVPPGEGMLFAFPEAGDRPHEFWMKDTIAALDMVFVRADGTVSSIAAAVPATKPHTPDDRVARRAGTGRFVIELAAGGAAAAGVRPGQRLLLPDIAAR